jgi:hypothetical protein
MTRFMNMLVGSNHAFDDLAFSKPQFVNHRSEIEITYSLPRKEITMKTRRLIATFATTVLLLGTTLLRAQDNKAKEQADLAAALKAAKISLQSGLSASASQGKPISGKFEVEDGKLQLSVYTMKGNEFSEVIVNHTNGTIAKTEKITSGDDLTAAKAQSEAMAKAKVSLSAATAKALSASKGFHAVSVVPALKDGHPVADITLANGADFKTVSEKLD